MVTAAPLPGQTHTAPRSEFDGPATAVGQPRRGEFTNVGVPAPEFQDVEEVVVPEDRVYVFYPEGPEDHVMVRGTKMRQFRNGRLISDVDGLTPDDLRWFRQQNMHLQRMNPSAPPKFVMWQGDPRGQSVLYMALQPRVTAVCTKKAAASNAQKITDDVTFTLQVMLSVTSQEPHLTDSWQGKAGTMRTIGALMPHVQETLGYQQVIEAEAQQAEDERAIQEGLAAMGGAQALDAPPATDSVAESVTDNIEANVTETVAAPLPDEENPFRPLGS